MIDEQTTTASTGSLNRFHRCVETIKTRVPIEAVADEYLESRLAGPNRLLARCPSPDHTDRTPSFTIFTDDQRFKCFGIGCGLYGDVIDLEKICGDHDQTWTALVALSERYGVELPERSDKWRRWQDEKSCRRDMVREALTESYQRRLFRVFGGHLDDIVDPEERREEARRFWEDLRPVAWRCALERTRQ